MELVPILVNYDHSRPLVGFLQWKDGAIRVKLLNYVTQDEFLEIFGTVGYRAIDVEFRDFIPIFKEADILCWSIQDPSVLLGREDTPNV